jgi:hypothetical protein
LLFAEQSVAAIINAVESLDVEALSPALIRAHAEKFDTRVFKRKIMDFVEKKLEENCSR